MRGTANPPQQTNPEQIEPVEFGHKSVRCYVGVGCNGDVCQCLSVCLRSPARRQATLWNINNSVVHVTYPQSIEVRFTCDEKPRENNMAFVDIRRVQPTSTWFWLESVQ